MVEYKCDKCKKIFKKKDHYINHHNRINPCDANISTNVCTYCGVKYSTKGNLMRHIKSRCSVFNEKENEKKQIFEELLKLKQEVNELKAGRIEQHTNGSNNGSNNINNSNNVNSNNNNNNINNITVVAFGKEKIDAIDIKTIVDAISAGFNAPVKLTKNIHFNPNNPEFHNVYIPNINNKCAMVYDGTKWNLAHRKDVIDDIYQDKKDYIEDNLDKFKESLTVPIHNALKRLLAIEDDDNATVQKIKKNIELLLYNERDIPLASHK